MSKRTGSHNDGDEPTPKRFRIGEGNHTISSGLHDPEAWEILRKFLTSDMSMGEMDAALESHLGSRFSAEDWVEPRHLLFSGDGDDAQSLTNLLELKIKYVPEPKSAWAIPVQQLRKPRKLHKQKNPYILDEADEDDDDDDDDDDDEEEEEATEGGGSSGGFAKVTRLLGPSAKDKLAATFDDMVARFEQNPASSSRGRQLPTEDRMYLLRVQRTATEYIAAHLRKRKFSVTVSAWIPGQLYVVADSPKTISQSLTSSLYLAVKDYVRITDEERDAVQISRSKLPDTSWVRITKGKYKDDVGRVFKSKEDFVEVLIAARDFPYKMPRGTRALVERSRLPNRKGTQPSDIILNGEVVGWSYKGESYYKGLLVKIFHRDHLELVASPHINDIQVHLESGWDTPFLKDTVVAFSMQFLRVGELARVVKGSLHGELGTVVSTDHACGSVGLEFNFDGFPQETEVSLQDIERVFRVGDTVRVVAGSYTGLEGYLIQMCGDLFHVCQEISKEVVEVSKYYLDRRPLKHTLKSHVPIQQHVEPPCDPDSIEIGDYIQVLDGEHAGKRGIVNWFPKGDTNLWFRDIFTVNDTESSLDGLLSISVPATMVQRTDLAQTIHFTNERGFDVRPGDTVSVARGPEFGAQGLVQHVDFPKARLSILCDGDKSIIHVPICFVIKTHNTALDSFKKDIGQEVFVIRGEWKGYRGTLDSISAETCTVALRGQVRGTYFPVIQRLSIIKAWSYPHFATYGKGHPSLPPSNRWSGWPASSNSVEIQHDRSSSANASSSSALQAWGVDELDIRDSIEARMEKIRDIGPLPWLMTKEFSSELSAYHVLFKVSVGFMNGKLQKRFVSTACPDPFCGENGPAPEGCVAVFCTSNSAGATLEHYHIPASDLSPAPPRKKNQECLILDGVHRGLIRTVTKCEITKKNTVDIKITPTVTVTLHSDQICLVERARN
ncbi:hypothetical protein BD769DRAFT_1380674 [Suillus cothurnatus]|nr:hypothetical protein BD769DRAFT_1380674 [Suillus cothurnatus]